MKSHQTPVIAIRRDHELFIPLPYGTDTDWVSNVIAAKHLVLQYHGSFVEGIEPSVHRDEKVYWAPRPVRIALRSLGSADYLHARLP